jgi:hypothetical protein
MATAKQRKAARRNVKKAQKARSATRRGRKTSKRSPAQRRAQQENLQKGRGRKKSGLRSMLGL